MNEQSVKDETWLDRTLTDNQMRVREAAALIPVHPTGANPENFAQLVDYAHWMSRAQIAVPAHLVGNVGACLAVIEIAKKFGYPAYMVARQSYVVNGVLSFMGQFIMAVINDFCPLRERLKFSYEGDNADLKIIVTGHFKSEVDPLVYESPRLKDVPVKKSPLWTSDPRQQFKYYGARRWQSAYWPEGLFGIFAVDDVLDSPVPEEMNVLTGGQKLLERLRAAEPNGEGFQDGHAHRELAQVAPDTGGRVIDAEVISSGAAPAAADGSPVGDAQPGAATGPSLGKRTSGARKVAQKGSGRSAKAARTVPAEPAAAKAADPPRTTSLERRPGPSAKAVKAAADRAEAAAKEPEPPKAKSALKTIPDYLAYAKAWIDASADHQAATDQWDDEMELRNKLQVPVADRRRLQDRIDAKFAG